MATLSTLFMQLVTAILIQVSIENSTYVCSYIKIMCLHCMYVCMYVYIMLIKVSNVLCMYIRKFSYVP